MAAIIQIVQIILGFVLPISGFYFVSRRPGHTRAQLVAAATLGGGLSGAVIAAIAASGGSPFFEALSWAFFGLVWGGVIGLAGVVAFALGRWLSHRP